MHVAWCGRLAPAPDGRRPTAEAVRELLGSRLHKVPRFRQRLAFPPPGLGEPFWTDDPDFDLRSHVTDLTEPDENVTLGSFNALCDALLSEPLDRRRPLWQLYLVPRLEDGSAGIVCKLHHAMVDGVSVVELGLLLFDSPGGEPGEPDGWEAAPPPGVARLAVEALTESGGRALRAAGDVAQSLARPQEMAAGALASAAKAGGAVADGLLRPAPRDRVNSPIGPERVLVRQEQDLAELLEIKRSAGVTLNDACLGVVAGALRLLAAERGEAPQPLKIMVPVSTRTEDEATDAGNRISFAFIDLPLAEGSTRRRLELIRKQTEAFKRSDRAGGFSTVLTTLGLLPAPLRGPVARVVGGPRTFNLVVSNIPGPPQPVSMVGCELIESYPVVPLAEDHSLSIGMFSYRDRMFFGAYADPHALPEVRDLPRLLAAATHDLAGATNGGRPGADPLRSPHRAGVPARLPAN
jgi:diacylglycerol O-acyltransferase / wax synthase